MNLDCYILFSVTAFIVGRASGATSYWPSSSKVLYAINHIMLDVTVFYLFLFSLAPDKSVWRFSMPYIIMKKFAASELTGTRLLQLNSFPGP